MAYFEQENIEDDFYAQLPDPCYRKESLSLQLAANSNMPMKKNSSG